MSVIKFAGIALLVGGVTVPALACSSLRGNSPPPSAAAQAAAQAFRRQVPKPGPQPQLQAPVPHRTSLDNQLSLFHVAKGGLPLVHVSVVIKSGSAQDPPGLEGLAGFTADMLKMGTKRHSAAALAQAVESRGSSIRVSVDEDALTLSTTALKDNIDAVFGIMVDELLHAAFAPAEVERVRQMRLAALQQRDSDPRQSVNQVFRKTIYGNHAYGHTPLGTATALKKITAAQLQAYAAQHLRPANAAVIVVGDMGAAAAQQMVQTHLGRWQTASHLSQGVQSKPAAPADHAAGISLVEREAAAQSQLMLGLLVAARDTPDYFPLTLCNAILGGLFNSRINMNLREDKGYTYGARSMVDFMRARGPWLVSGGITSKETGAAIVEIYKEVETMRTTKVSEEELISAKNRYSLSLPGSFQTVDALAGMVAAQYMYDLPLDYYQRLPERLAAVTAEDVQRVAQTYLQPQKFSIVVVGDTQVVGKSLEALHRGQLQRRDSQGNLLDN